MAAEISRRGRRGDDIRKKSRKFRLAPKVEAAQRILATQTGTDVIETALDMVIFRDELIRGTKAAFGIEFHEQSSRRGNASLSPISE